MREMQLIIDGTKVTQIKHDGYLQLPGTESVRRASHVLPLPAGKRFLFVLLRTVFGETGRVSEWTRTWTGPHIVEIIDGPTLGPFPTRQEALDREVQWLLKNRF